MPQKEIPFVSILIAARNEQDNIGVCLQAIDQIKYPKDCYEVWIGNDDSEDNTEEIIRNFIADKPNFHLLNITSTIGNAKGKANVLAQLAKNSKGEFLLMTDADVAVPKSWIDGMIENYEEGIGIMTGCTLAQPSSFFARLESIDWVYALSLIKGASHTGVGLTAMGNNMLVRKEAYEQIGGYETIPFSLTEDHELFKAITQKGWKFKQIMQPEITAETVASQSILQLLQQRKRWVHGAIQAPWYILIVLTLQAMFLPILVGLYLYSPLLAYGVWWLKFAVQSIIAGNGLYQIGRTKLLIYLIPYEFYNLLVSFFTAIFYLLPIKVRWKGRVY